MHTHPFAGIRRHVSSLMVFVFTLVQVIPPGDLMTPAWACPKPTLNSATPGANQVALAWSPVGVANYYKVYYGTTSGSWGTPINVGNVTSYSVTGLNAGTKYYFAVTAVDNYGESAKSNIMDATTYSDPPVLNSATGGTNQVGLAWSASSGATSYKVYYGTESGVYGTPVDAGNVTSYTVTGLTAGTTYYFAVTAVNAGGESAVSNELNAPTIPAAPVLDSATGESNQVTIYWGAVDGATSYKVYYGTESGVYGTPVNVGDVTGYAVSGLEAATTYYFVVTAVNASGESDISNELDATTLPDAPVPPVLNSATAGVYQVTLAWDAVEGATSYLVYLGVTTGVYTTSIEAGDVTEYVVDGLTPGTRYYFAVTAVNAGGESAKSNELNAVPQAPPLPTVSITACPRTIILGDSSLLSWQSSDADSCSISPGIGDVDLNGSVAVTPEETTTYTITATGAGGTAISRVTVIVGNAATPTVTISASPQTITNGSSTTLTWSSSNATSFFIDHGVGAVDESGSITVQPSVTTTYTITVTGPLGSASAEVTVSVTGSPTVPEAGTFGSRYSSLIPADATVASYAATRFSVVRGEVKDINGAPVADVMVNILNHAAYGTAHTDAEGKYALPVEGGGALNVTFRKDGFIPVHRQVGVGPNDITVIDTITMIAEDTQSTEVTLDGNPETVVVHRSTTVTDTAGTRRASVVLTGDTRAWAVDAYGNDMFELTKLNIRATEFTTPESMPAILPPTTSFTYCAEFKVDGIERVRFSQPVVIWLDNFLEFDVGETVPVGYYDRDNGEWVPSANGKVVQLLDTDSDGVVDALDATGDGVADDLNDNSDFSDEVTGLGDPAQYQPGQTYWRVEVAHFTSLDLNFWAWLEWIAGLSPTPNAQGNANVDQQGDPCDDYKKPTASYVSCRSRIYHEDIDLPGTGLTLHYASNRAPGYKTVITVPASGATVPSQLRSIRVKLEIAGRVLVQVLPASPNQVAEFVWDGLDYLGQRVGSATAVITTQFVYDGAYYGYGTGTVILPVFGIAGGIRTVVVSRDEVTAEKQETIVIHNQSQVREMLATGWTLSNQHYMSAVDTSTLFTGDGEMLKNDAGIITTLATFPGSGYSYGYPQGIAADRNGNVYVALFYQNYVAKIDTDGVVSLFHGGYDGPIDVAVDKDGNVYFADYGARSVHKVDTSGVFSTVTSNLPSYPLALAVDDNGNIYISDLYSVYKRAPGGTLTQLAGQYGVTGYSGDGGPSTLATFDGPYGLAVDKDGNIYIADIGNNRIRKIDTGGIITTVAGTGVAGFSGDGGLATEATFNGPHGVTLDRDGNLYVADFGNSRVRKIDTAGIITTVAGNGLGYNGDGGPATAALTHGPVAVALDAAGNIYLSDYYNSAVRKVSSLNAVPADPGEMAFSTEDEKYVFSLDGKHRRTLDIDTKKILEQFTYDASDRLVSVADRFGNQVTIERDASGVPTRILSPDGLPTSLTVDSNNHLTRITLPGGAYYTFEYSTSGLMTKETEPKGNFFTHVFDANGHITNAQDEEGADDAFARSVAADTGDVTTTVTGNEGTVVTYVDQAGSGLGWSSTATVSGVTTPTLYSRSSDGLSYYLTRPDQTVVHYRSTLDPEEYFTRLSSLTVTTPLGLQKVETYGRTYADTNSDGINDLITDTTSVNGKITTATKDTLAGLVTATSPLGRTMTLAYDPVTLLTSQISVSGLTPTSYLYDTRGRMTSATVGTRTALWTYDTSGNLASYRDPKNQYTYYTYDSVGRVLSVTRPDTTVVGFTYDANGNMTRLTNPASAMHDFTYDDANREKTYDPPVSGVTQSVYDAEGRLTQVLFPSGKQINNVYTGALLTQVQLAEGNINLMYLASGQISTLAKSGETVTYTYDGSLVTGESWTGTLTQSLSYTYDNNFEVTSFAYAGATSTFGYDNDGLLTSAGGFTVTRDANNGLPTAVAGGALAASRAFNGFGEVSGQSTLVNGLAAGEWALTYDGNGQIVTKTETFGGITAAYEYGYDLNGRLLTVYKDGTLVEEYRYNDPGNPGLRTYEMNVLRGIVPGRSLYYNSEDQLLSVGGTTYLYDADGYLAQKIAIGGTTTYAYSTRGELLTATLPDTRVISYVYDPFGRRIAKKINGVITEKYLWGGLTTLLAVYDGSDNLLMRFQYTDERMPYIMTVGESTYYLLYNQVGSLRAVYDSSGTIVKRIDYDSFGNIITDTAPTFTVPFGFAGGLRDVDTGLVHFGYRDYDPETGRWMAKDPTRFDGGDIDLYGYVVNNPENWVDPKGLAKGTPKKPKLPKPYYFWGQCSASDWADCIKQCAPRKAESCRKKFKVSYTIRNGEPVPTITELPPPSCKCEDDSKSREQPNICPITGPDKPNNPYYPLIPYYPLDPYYQGPGTPLN